MPESVRILIADDSRVSRSVVICLMRMRVPQAEFLEAGDGLAALKLAMHERPALSVLDINMPELTGLDVAEQLRTHATELPLAILTANVQDATRARADAMGVPMFRKPVKAEVIDEILKLLPAA